LSRVEVHANPEVLQRLGLAAPEDNIADGLAELQ
jgi:hypothetical protein